MENKQIAKERIEQMDKAGLDLLVQGKLIVLVDGNKTLATTDTLLRPSRTEEYGMAIMGDLSRSFKIKESHPENLHVRKSTGINSDPKIYELSNGDIYIFYPSSLRDLNLRKRFVAEGVEINYPFH